MNTDLIADLRSSLRTLRRTPLFAITAISALTLGIGANTPIFSVVNTVLLTRLPYPDSDRIVVFTTQTPAGAFGGTSPTKLDLWKEQGGVFEEVSAYRFRFANVKGGTRDEQIPVGEVSTDFFPLFGGSFEQGRAFSVDEQRPGGETSRLSVRDSRDGTSAAADRKPRLVDDRCGVRVDARNTRHVHAARPAKVPKCQGARVRRSRLAEGVCAE